MTGNKLDVLVFDLDGTLADTAPDLAAALNHTLVEMGRPTIEARTVRTLIGHGVKALLRKGLATSGPATEGLVEQGYPIFMQFYGAHLCEGTRGFEGVEQALMSMSDRGLSLAICTNKPERLAVELVRALGWSHFFNSIVGGDTLPVRKPDPAPLHAAIAAAGGGRAAFVGDSITDADTARGARVPLIAVSFGYLDRPADAFGARVVIDHFSELAGAVDRI